MPRKNYSQIKKTFTKQVHDLTKCFLPQLILLFRSTSIYYCQSNTFKMILIKRQRALSLSMINIILTNAFRARVNNECRRRKLTITRWDKRKKREMVEDYRSSGCSLGRRYIVGRASFALSLHMDVGEKRGTKPREEGTTVPPYHLPNNGGILNR